jgi:hypothetical protein
MALTAAITTPIRRSMKWTSTSNPNTINEEKNA